MLMEKNLCTMSVMGAAKITLTTKALDTITELAAVASLGTNRK